DQVNAFQYPVINIDIGGGTTDIVMFQNKSPKFLTSIKFAGNTVFGDGYNKDISANNGFVTVFKSVVETFLDNNRNDLPELYGVFNQLNHPGRSTSSDMMAFFFSLEQNNELISKRLNFDFSDRVGSHEEFNIVFVVFFGAIIYHIAKIMNRLDCEMPRNICLSGNGSKIINLLDTDRNLTGVEKLSKLIFEEVYGRKYHKEGLSIIQGKEPKEATCRGGIKKLNNNMMSGDFDRIVLLGDEESTIVNTKSQNFEESFLKYQEITESHKTSTIEEINTFIDLLFSLNNRFDFEDYFDIDPSLFAKSKIELKKDLRANLNLGLSERIDESNQDKNIEESIFFYPLVNSLYRLTKVIAGDQ
ncbi:MAG: hypothetical protein AAFO82_08490, partial [Bacteroidota bacterium]